MRLQFRRILRLTPTTIVLLYVLIGILWTFYSDRLLYSFFPDPEIRAPFHTFKGWFFVGITALVLYVAIRTSQRAIRRAEMTLSAREEQLRLALEGSDEGFWEWRPESEKLQFSARNLTLLGYAPDEFEVTAETWGALIHPHDREAIAQVLDGLRAGQNETFRVEYRIRAKDGEYRWLLCRGKVAERGRDGRAQRILGTHVDITTRRHMEDDLRESEERFRALLASSPDMVFLLDREQRILYVNEASANAFGVRPEQMVGRKQSDFFDPQTAMRYNASIQRIFEGGALLHSESERTVGMRRQWVETRLVPVKGLQGEVVSVLAIERDVTVRREAETTLREAYQLISEILESISDGFFALDDQTVVRIFNKAAERMLGCEASKAVGRPFFEVFPAFSGSVFEEKLRRAIETRKDVFFETELTRAPFQNWYDVRAFPLHGGLSVFFRVTTEQKRLQSRLLQMQRMEAVARLAGGIAHDFNNQLAAILGYNELLAHDLPENHAGRQRLAQIRKAAERAALLTRQLLAFGRKQVLEPAILDLNLVVADLSEMLRRMVGEDVELSVSLAPDLRRARIDRAQLEQALINMAANARDAMPSGGKLTIATRNVVLDEEHCRRHIEATPGHYVVLVMSDTGCGMDEFTLQHLFEPFFTTKEAGQATGLVLSSIYGFVTQSGGHLAVASERGRGSQFSIYLPQVMETDESAAIAEEALLAGSADAATVLVVEDEEIVRRLISEVLEEAGYRVLSAIHGAEACQIADAHAGTIDLLVTDVIMPNMSGRQLAESLRRFHPRMGVLYVSGYPQDAIKKAGSIEPGAPFLQKPFVPTLLIQLVRQILLANR